jgi:hypothetical protein
MSLNNSITGVSVTNSPSVSVANSPVVVPNTGIVFSNFNQTTTWTNGTVILGPASVGNATNLVVNVFAITGGLRIQGSSDNTVWTNIQGYRYDSSANIPCAISVQIANSANNYIQFNLGGFQYWRIISFGTTSGNLNINYALTNTNPANIVGYNSLIVPNVNIGGFSTSLLSATSPTTATSSTVVKASAGNVGAISMSNTSNNPVFLHLCDSATVTPGTTSEKNIFYCPTGTSSFTFTPYGLSYGTGISYYLSALGALKDVTNLSANTPVTVNISFY